MLQQFAIDAFYQTPEELMNLFPIPTVIIHKSSTILYANHRFAHLHNSTLDQMIGRKISSFSEAAGKSVEGYFATFARRESIDRDEIYVNGFYFQILIQPIYDKNNRVEAIFCFQWNISKIKRLQQVFHQNNKRHKEQLRFDQITHVANEYALEDYVFELKKSSQENEHTIVVLIDVDHFDEFNREHGFMKANAALYAIAQTLKFELRRESDYLIKLNRDRFFIMFPNISYLSAFTIAERLRNSIYQLNLQHQAGIDQRLTISIILHTVFIEKLTALNHLIHMLGDQLSLNKYHGRNRCTEYNQNPQAIRAVV